MQRISGLLAAALAALALLGCGGDGDGDQCVNGVLYDGATGVPKAEKQPDGTSRILTCG